MNLLFKKTSDYVSASVQFDQLRSRLEVEVERPSSIVVTSSTSADGKRLLAQALAHSFASAGYSTLYVDATIIAGGSAISGNVQLPFEELARRAVADKNVDDARVMTFGDARLQKGTSKREIQAALEILAGKFDFVIINADSCLDTPFASSLAAVAGAVLACIRSGRREKRSDALLASELERVGSRFVGIVAVEKSAINSEVSPSTLRAVTLEKGGLQIARPEKVREVASY